MSLLTRNKAPKLAEHNAGRKLFGSRGATITVWIIAIFWTIPTLGLFATSFRPKAEISATGWWNFFIHPHLTLGNYSAIFSSGTTSGISNGIMPYVINSFVITIPAVIFPITIATMAAYCLAWVKFRGSDALFYGIFALQIVPIQVALVPLLNLFTGGVHVGTVTVIPALHIAGTFLGIWLPHTMFALPLAIYLLHNFISQLPRDLMEAANVDGASHFKVFRSIVLPLSVPAIASFTIFHWELLTSSAFVTIVVPLVVFFSLQRYFVRGLLAGSVK